MKLKLSKRSIIFERAFYKTIQNWDTSREARLAGKIPAPDLQVLSEEEDQILLAAIERHRLHAAIQNRRGKL